RPAAGLVTRPHDWTAGAGRMPRAIEARAAHGPLHRRTPATRRATPRTIPRTTKDSTPVSRPIPCRHVTGNLPQDARQGSTVAAGSSLRLDTALEQCEETSLWSIRRDTPERVTAESSPAVSFSPP